MSLIRAYKSRWADAVSIDAPLIHRAVEFPFAADDEAVADKFRGGEGERESPR